MADYHFYIGRYESDDKVTDIRDLEKYFPGLRYKQLTGLNGYGAPKVYSETFVESDEADVFVPDTAQAEQTELTLTLYFFGVTDGADDATLYSEASKCYHSFMAHVSGALLLYFDSARKRKVKVYLSSASSPKTDRLYGVPYLEVDFKFKNLFGRSFALGDEALLPTITM